MEQKKQRSEAWEPMRLRYIGDVEELVQMTTGTGQGKSAAGADPGDIFKPPGQG